MEAELMELGRRAVACKSWRWMDGMSCRWRSDPEPESKRWWEVRLTDDRHTWEVVDSGTWDNEPATDGPIPDLSDPATLGCLQALVREAHDGAVVITEGNGWWSVETEDTTRDGDDLPSFAHGLVWALEAQIDPKTSTALANPGEACEGAEHDVEGVPLCSECWKVLLKETHRAEGVWVDLLHREQGVDLPRRFAVVEVPNGAERWTEMGCATGPEEHWNRLKDETPLCEGSTGGGEPVVVAFPESEGLDGIHFIQDFLDPEACANKVADLRRKLKRVHHEATRKTLHMWLEAALWDHRMAGRGFAFLGSVESESLTSTLAEMARNNRWTDLEWCSCEREERLYGKLQEWGAPQ